MTGHQNDLDVLCLGILVADALAKPIERMPQWRQLELVDHVELQAGGCANNTATGAARLGLRVGVMGKVGCDGFGDFIFRHLNAQGIDTRGLRRDEGFNTSFTFVMIARDGERAFFHYVGANGALRYEDIDLDLIERSRILHIAGSFVMPGLDGEPTARILRRARAMGVTTCLDTVWNSSIEPYQMLEDSLPHLDYFLPSIDEARLISEQDTPEDVAGFFIDRGVGTVGLKMGAEGCYLRSESEEVSVPAFETNVVDTSGAGDAWISGFLTGIVRGWDTESAARLGNAAGAMCASAIGTTAGLKSFDETVEFMRGAKTLAATP